MSLLAACGPESEEAGDLDLIGSQVSGVTQVAASQDPIPARNPVTPVAGQALVLTPVNANGTILLVPTAVNPVEPRSASQDPIPARTPGETLGVTVDATPSAPRNPSAPRL